MKKIKVEYNGKFPILCGGQLTLTIENIVWKFPILCLESGGECIRNKNKTEKVTHGKWTIKKYPKNFPEKLKQCAEDAVNSNIRFGCCGGCI